MHACALGMRRFCFGGEERTGGDRSRSTRTAKDDDGMTSTSMKGTRAQRALSRRTFLKATGSTAALVAAAKATVLGGANVAWAAGPEVTKAVLGYIALIDASALVIAKEKGLFRQARHAGRRGRQAGLVGRHARQPGAGLGEQRHRRRAHPDADALPDLDRQGDAEQRADADVPDGAAEPRCAGHLGRAGIQGPRRHHRRFAAQGRVREEEGRGQGSEGRHDLPRRHARPLDPLLAGRRPASIRTRIWRPSWCRRRRWWPT